MKRRAVRGARDDGARSSSLRERRAEQLASFRGYTDRFRTLTVSLHYEDSPPRLPDRNPISSRVLAHEQARFTKRTPRSSVRIDLRSVFGGIGA